MRAFTLVEVLVSTFIMSIIIAMLFAVLSIGQRSWFTGAPATELREAILQSVMRMEREVSKTKPTRTNLISIGDSSASLVFDVPNDNNGDGSIVDNMGGIEWGANSITYSRDGSNQLIRTSGGASSVISTNITSLLFTRIADKLIQVDITAQKTSQLEQLIQDTEQPVIKMRN